MGIQKIKYSSNRLFLIVSGLFAILSFFTIPYLAPSRRLVVSTSYDYGFNNQIGVLLVWCSIIIFSLWGYTKRLYYASFFSELRVNGNLPIRNLVLSIILFAIYLMFCYLLCGDDLAAGWGECSYFLPHVYDMVQGYRPYEDFVFYYGPLMVYTPFWIYSFFPVSVVPAYLIALFFFHGIGLFMLYEVGNRLNTEVKFKKYIFWISFLVTFPTALGMNYQILRYILPFWCFIKVREMNNVRAIIFSPLFIILTLSMSPEYGLVFFIVLNTFYVFRYYIEREKLIVLVIISSSFFPLIFMYIFRPMFSMFLSFSSGMYNFPFIPSFHLIVFFIFIIILAYLMGGGFYNYRHTYFELFYVIMAIGLIPAALGRCDPGHVVYNGFFVFLFVSIYLVNLYKKSRIYILMINIILVLMIQISLIRANWYDMFFSTVFNSNISSSNMSKTEYMNNLENKLSIIFGENQMKHISGKLKIIFQPTIDEMNFVSSLSSGNDNYILPIISSTDMLRNYIYLTEKGRCYHLYISRMSMSGNVADVERTIKELCENTSDFLLVEKGWELLSGGTVGPSFQDTAADLFYTYFPKEPYRNGRLVYLPLVNYIKDNYYTYKSCGNFSVLKRKT